MFNVPCGRSTNRCFTETVAPRHRRIRDFASSRSIKEVFCHRFHTEVDAARLRTSDDVSVAIDEANGEVLALSDSRLKRRHEQAAVCDPAEVRSRNRGLGWALMQLMIAYAKSDGLKRIFGQILHENTVMLKMCRELGFEVKTDPDDYSIYDVTLVLEPSPENKGSL